LEQTEDADDISGANNCPMHLRITAIGMLDYAGRVSFQTPGRNIYIPNGRPSGTPRLAIWAVIKNKVETVNEQNALEVMGVTWKAVISAKSRAVLKDRTAKEARLSGNRFGWKDPPSV